MKSYSSFCKALLLASAIIYANQAYTQGKFELSGGYGVPELFNLGVKYGNNTQIGAHGGIFPFEWYGNTVVDWSCGVEIIYHFIGKSKFVDQHPWFISGGLAYHDLGVMNRYEEYDISLCPRIGGTLNFSKSWGVQVAFGLFLPLSVTSGYDSYDFIMLPSGSISLFIRL